MFHFNLDSNPYNRICVICSQNVIFFFISLDIQLNQQFSSLRTPLPDTRLTPNSDPEESDDIYDDKSVGSASDDSQIHKQNTIFIWSLPFNMSEQRLFDTLWDVFSTVGQIKVPTKINARNQILRLMIFCLD